MLLQMQTAVIEVARCVDLKVSVIVGTRDIKLVKNDRFNTVCVSDKKQSGCYRTAWRVFFKIKFYYGH